MLSTTMRMVLGAAIIIVCASTPDALAATLLPGGDVVPNLLADNPNLTNFLADTGMQNFDVTQAGVHLVGNGRAAVVDNYASNPFGLNALTFLYQVTLDSSSPAGEVIEHLVMSNFAGVATDVGFYQVGGLVNPVDVSRSAGSGDTISFNFVPGGIPTAMTTSVLIINTDATRYAQGTLTIQGGASVTLNAFGAAVLVPEPAAIVGAATSLVLVGGFSLHRRSRSSRAA